MKKEILFWGPEGEYGFLDNFFPASFEVNGKLWTTSEHYFQAMKTLDPAEQEQVRVAHSPGESKRLGQKVSMRPDWHEVRYNVMVEALRLKFVQNPGLHRDLLATGDAIIHEDSPYDFVWGWRKNKQGKPGLDLLGKALMQVRGEFGGRP
jgi:ribA/ribD-fused uncharacterized protein